LPAIGGPIEPLAALYKSGWRAPRTTVPARVVLAWREVLVAIGHSGPVRGRGSFAAPSPRTCL